MAKEKLKLTAEQYASLELVTPRFTGMYLHLQTKGMYQGKETNYNFTMAFPKDADLKELRSRLTRAKILWWGKDQAKWPKNYATPIEDGDNITKEDGTPNEQYAGFWVVKATSNDPIVCVDSQGNAILESGKIYAGAIYRAHIQASVYELSKTNIGVKFYAKGLQKVAEGEKLGNKGNSRKAFAAVADEGDDGVNDESNYEGEESESDSASMW
jgi:hypothetical protein